MSLMFLSLCMWLVVFVTMLILARGLQCVSSLHYYLLGKGDYVFGSVG